MDAPPLPSSTLETFQLHQPEKKPEPAQICRSVTSHLHALVDLPTFVEPIRRAIQIWHFIAHIKHAKDKIIVA